MSYAVSYVCAPALLGLQSRTPYKKTNLPPSSVRTQFRAYADPIPVTV